MDRKIMRKLAAILGMLGVILVVLLGTSVLNPSARVDAVLNESFTLKIGQSAFIQSDSIKVTLLNVTEDSRCPIGVECIWAGQAGVLVNIEKTGQNLGDFKLITNQGNSTAVFGGYEIKLEKVEPYPREGRGIEHGEYIVGLVVYNI